MNFWQGSCWRANCPICSLKRGVFLDSRTCIFFISGLAGADSSDGFIPIYICLRGFGVHKKLEKRRQVTICNLCVEKNLRIESFAMRFGFDREVVAGCLSVDLVFFAVVGEAVSSGWPFLLYAEGCSSRISGRVCGGVRGVPGVGCGGSGREAAERFSGWVFGAHMRSRQIRQAAARLHV